MTKYGWIRMAAIITIIGVAILMAGYRLTQPEPELVVADRARVKTSPAAERALSLQATTIEDLEVRRGPAASRQMVVFYNEEFDYHIDYPFSWNLTKLAANLVLFESPDGDTSLKVEAVGPLPADGLAPLVDRSMSDELVINRQLLTVHGAPAERVISLSETLGTQVTNFFIDGDTSAYVITGQGEQRTIEMMARSFNAPHLVARR